MIKANEEITSDGVSPATERAYQPDSFTDGECPECGAQRLRLYRPDCGRVQAEDERGEFKRQRDDLSAEMERCHRMLDRHYGEPEDTTSMETLEDRLKCLLEDAALRSAGWIDVSLQLPRDGERVLVCLVSGEPHIKIVEDQDREIRHAKFLQVKEPRFFLYGYENKSGWFSSQHISHWMPLPALPSETPEARNGDADHT